MPVGKLKNTLYGLALPVLGRPCGWRQAQDQNGAAVPEITRALKNSHVVGATVQRFEKGRLTDCITAGYASLEGEKRPAAADTVYRTASIAKLATALLVFRLQSMDKLDVREDISAFVRELSELCHALWRVAVAWGRTPATDAARWAAHLAAGCHLLRQVCDELPRLWQEHELHDRAEAVYDWRREADRLWAESEDPAYEAALSLARVADTAQWLALKNT
jgi:hypothetical protein